MDDKRVDGITLLLFVGVLVMTGLLFVDEKLFPTDGQMFQVVAGLLTAFSGALFTRIKPPSTQTAQPPVVPPALPAPLAPPPAAPVP